MIGVWKIIDEIKLAVLMSFLVSSATCSIVLIASGVKLDVLPVLFPVLVIFVAAIIISSNNDTPAV